MQPANAFFLLNQSRSVGRSVEAPSRTLGRRQHPRRAHYFRPHFDNLGSDADDDDALVTDETEMNTKQRRADSHAYRTSATPPTKAPPMSHDLNTQLEPEIEWINAAKGLRNDRKCTNRRQSTNQIRQSNR
ncbi:unnamed protein product [Soboliphyme baturini]|uniref:Uncharacterized protein n=1 Tax=Soboliphyme baturini TaxID=241478 RepID=A0A183J996_9BILA|nr:unnamed protein product [Soboliphyme baturini]